MGLPDANFRKCFGTRQLPAYGGGQTLPTAATSNDIFSKICAELWLQLFLGNCSTAKFNYSLSHTHWHTHTHVLAHVTTYKPCKMGRGSQAGRQANRDKAASRETSQMASHVSMANEVMCKSQWRRGRGQVPADWHSLPAQLSPTLLFATLCSVCPAPLQCMPLSIVAIVLPRYSCHSLASTL